MLGMEIRNRKRRQALRNSAKARTDRLHRQMKEVAHRRAGQHAHNRCRHTPRNPRQHHQNQQCTSAQRQRRRIEARKMCGQQLDTRQKFARYRANAKPEEVLDLGRCNQDGNAVGESNHHRPRNEPYRRAEPGQSHGQQNNACHERHQRESAQSKARHNTRDDDDKRACRTADLRARTAQRRNQKSCDHCRVKARLRRNARSNTESHRQRKRNKADRNAGEQIAHQHLRRIAPQGQQRLGKIWIAE